MDRFATLPFSSLCWKLPSLFPSTISTKLSDFDAEDSGSALEYQIAVSHAADSWAVYSRQTLYLCSCDGGSFENGNLEVLVEVEFDADIMSVAWDCFDCCVSVLDRSGTLHLLDTNGSILLSKKMISLTENEVCQMTFCYAGHDSKVQQLAILLPCSQKFVILSNIDLSNCSNGEMLTSKVLLESFKSIKMSSCVIPSANWKQSVIIANSEGHLCVFASDKNSNELRHYIITEGLNCELVDPLPVSINCDRFVIAGKMLLVISASSNNNSTQLIAIDTTMKSVIATYVFDDMNDLQFLSIAPVKCDSEIVRGWRLLLFSSSDHHLFNLSLIANGDHLLIISHGREATGDQEFISNAVVGPIFLVRDLNSSHVQMGTSTAFSMQMLEDILLAVKDGDVARGDSFASILASCINGSSSEGINDISSTALLFSNLRFPAELVCCASVILDSVIKTSSGMVVQIVAVAEEKLRSFGQSAPALTDAIEIMGVWKAVYMLAIEYAKGFFTNVSAKSVVEAALFPSHCGSFFTELIAMNQLKQLLFMAEQDIWRPDLVQIIHFIKSMSEKCHHDIFSRCVSLLISTATKKNKNAMLKATAAEVTEWDVWEALFTRAKMLAEHGNGHSSLQLMKLIHTSAQASTHPDSCGYASQFLHDVKDCVEIVTLMMSAQSMLGMPCSFSDARRFGLLGILLDAIDAEEEVDMDAFIKSKLQLICVKMNANPDDMLLAWLDRAMQDRILSSTGGIDDTHETTVVIEASISIAKLMRVACCVENVEAAGKAMLKLFLLPDVEKAAVIDHTVFDCVLNKTMTIMTATKGNLHDKLQEALRSFRMKCMAIRYKIEGFDPRSKLQLGALIAMMVNRKLGGEMTWVADVVYCAYDGEVERFNLRPHLFREIVRRQEACELSQLDDILVALEKRCPLTVMISVMTTCIEHFAKEMNEVFDAATKCTEKERNSRLTSLLKAGLLLCKHVQYAHEDKGSLVTSQQQHHKGIEHFEFIFIRMLVLQEMGLYLSFDQLQSPSFCKTIIKTHLENEFKLTLKAATTSDLHQVHRLYTKLEKVCSALDVSKQFAIRELVQLCIARGRKELALEVMQWNASELEQIERNSTILTDDHHLHSIVQEEEEQVAIDMDDLVDQGLLLSQTAMKSHQAVSTYGYYTEAQSKSSDNFEIQAYTAVERLMKIAVRIGENRALCLAIDTVNATNLTRKVMERIESASTDTLKNSGEIASITVAVPEDGLLMQKDVILPVLSQYLMRELLNKQMSYGQDMLSTSNHKKTVSKKPLKQGTSTTSASSVELEKLVEVLQRLENHNLAVYALFQSWSMTTNKQSMLKSSLISLSRKLLSYRNIHETFAIACLSCLPMETMVKELRNMVPSIQNDYSRLHTLALIGEELSYLWDQESLLLLFQSLQTNAKWWNTLSNIHIKVDMKLFQSVDINQREDYLFSLVPDILRTSQLNLELALDYCRSFDIHTEKAILLYIQLMIEKVDFDDLTSWASKITKAAAGLEERMLLAVLSQSLFKVHPLHYEKIIFVTKWIADLLPVSNQDDGEEDDEVDQSHESNGSNEENNQSHAHYHHHNVSTIAEEEDNATTTKANKVQTKKVEAKVEIINAVICDKISSLINYLQTLKFADNCLQAFRDDPVLSNFYRGVKGEAALRMPVWSLRADPWSVLDHVLAFADQIMLEKIVPLCFLLEIDKQQFDARSLFALYRCKRMALQEQHVVNPVKMEEIRHDFTTQLRERIPNIFTRLVVWDLIFQSEAKHGERIREHALFALQSSLQEIDLAKKTSMRSSELDQARDKLEVNARQLQLYDHLLSLLTTLGYPTMHSTLMSFTCNDQSASRLLSSILEMLVESLWSQQNEAAGGGCGYTIGKDWLRLSTSFNVAVMKRLQEAKMKIIDMCTFLGNSSNKQQSDSLDLAISEFISRMLVEGSAEFRSSRVTAATGLEENNINSLELWRKDDKDQVHIATAAEMRRREDTFLAFAIAITLELHSDDMKRNNIVQQLHSIVRLVGNKPMKRLTTRSRLRAVLALLRLGYGQQQEHDDNDMSLYGRLLYCLAEMHEIRLTTSDEALMNGLGLQIIDEPNKVLQEMNDVRSLNTRAIIMTWLHDEGEHDDVVELARDVFFLSPQQDWQVMIKLLKHMAEHDMKRVLLSTIMLMEEKGMLKKLLWDPVHHALAGKLLSMAEGVSCFATVVNNKAAPRHVTSKPVIFVISKEATTDAVSSTQGPEGGKSIVNKLMSKNIATLPQDQVMIEPLLLLEAVARLCASFHFYRDMTVKEDVIHVLCNQLLDAILTSSEAIDDGDFKFQLSCQSCAYLLSDSMLGDEASKTRVAIISAKVVQCAETVMRSDVILKVVAAVMSTEEWSVVLDAITTKATKLQDWMGCLLDYILLTRNSLSSHGGTDAFCQAVVKHCVQISSRPEQVMVAQAALQSRATQEERNVLVQILRGCATSVSIVSAAAAEGDEKVDEGEEA